MRQTLTTIPPVTLITAALAMSGWLYYLYQALRLHLHWMQLEDYSPTRLVKFASQRWRTIFLHTGLVGVGLTVVAQYILKDNIGLGWKVEGVALGLFGILSAVEAWRLKNSATKAKKKLVMTSRATRIFVIGFIVALVGIKFIGLIFPDGWLGLTITGSLYLTAALSTLWLSIAASILWPQEKMAQNRYMADARRILGEVRPLVVGVTGSYGKTGTKEMLASMLADRYNLYRPPGSYNTLMGVTRAIREGLRPYHEAFVVEMGAYHEGSIAKLCNLVPPTHGIVTAVGVQHLERFGSRETIQRAKGELVRALPPDGVAVLNGDDPFCREMAGWRQGETIFFGVEGAVGGRPIPPLFNSEALLPADSSSTPSSSSTASRSATIARNIRISLTGSDFDLTFSDGETLPLHLSLLGRAAVANACAAATLAVRLGVSKEGVARALASMSHVRHRLEPKRGDGGVTVIDDAFNSNPSGAACALEVLASATGGRRVLVTPGMIELGELEVEANRRFGRQAAKACDLAVLVGVKRIEPIRQGLLDQGFAADNIWVVPTLTEGLARLTGWLKPGDTMLLENDLPDQYAGM